MRYFLFWNCDIEPMMMEADHKLMIEYMHESIAYIMMSFFQRSPKPSGVHKYQGSDAA